MNHEFAGIVCSSVDDLRGRTLISDVTISDRDNYENGAIVPGLPERLSSSDQLLPYLATDDTPSSGAIEIIGYSKKLDTYLREEPLPPELAPTVCSPHQLTTTENKSNGNLRPGLHFDSKENRPMRDRIQSQRRIGINYGPGGRFLLVGTLDASEITNLLGYGPDYIPDTGTVHEYVTRQQCNPDDLPKLRCLWIFLRRGEGYIAPTESIVHDGSTAGVNDGSTIRFWLNAPARGAIESIV